jgi:LysM repeat protein
MAFGALGALIAAVAYLVVTSGGSPTPSLASAVARTAGHKARNWIVRPGQTLSSIAAREHVSLTELERLNPRLIPASLASGQRVKLPG